MQIDKKINVGLLTWSSDIWINCTFWLIGNKTTAVNQVLMRLVFYGVHLWKFDWESSFSDAAVTVHYCDDQSVI